MKQSLRWLLAVTVLASSGPAQIVPSQPSRDNDLKEEFAECVRGESVRVLQTGRSKFRRVTRKLAEETLTNYDAGFALDIRHVGCTLDSLIFIITWNQPPANRMKSAVAILEALPATESFMPVLTKIAAAAARIQPGMEGIRISETEGLYFNPSTSATRLRFSYERTPPR